MFSFFSSPPTEFQSISFAAFDDRDLAERLKSASERALAYGCMLHLYSIKNGPIDERRDGDNTITIIFTHCGLKPASLGCVENSATASH